MYNKMLASRYAEAYLSLAVEENKLASAQSDMLMVKNTLAQKTDLSSQLFSPLVSVEKKEGLLKGEFEHNLEPFSVNFLRLIAKKGRSKELQGIIDEVLEQYLVMQGIKKAKVTSAVALTKEQEQELIQQIKAQTGAKQIELTKETDSALLAGLKIEIDDKLWDDTLSRKLQTIQQKLKEIH